MNSSEMATIYEVRTLKSAGGRNPRGPGTLWKIAGYELRDVVRSRWVIFYGAFFAALAEALLRFSGGSVQALVGLTNVVLLLVPLVGLLFATMYLYSARDFIEMLLSQPVDRKQLYGGLYVGLALPLSIAYGTGISIPFIFRGLPVGVAGPLALMVLAGIFLTLIFVGFAFAITTRNDERVQGLALALGLWLLLTVVYDAVVLMVLQIAVDYPLETPALLMMVFNPVDLARVLLLLEFDVAALMGYTGAVFERFLGSTLGSAAALAVLFLWTAIPFAVSRRWFRQKDF